ncbi:hypothetical protein, partial [Mycobacterium paraintracellulare]|uniref:hypothetical protein n=1 Tax=Mycobacterium paraintracellulare TaxID=1138383 RepID=UPI003F687BD2
MVITSATVAAGFRLCRSRDRAARASGLWADPVASVEEIRADGIVIVRGAPNRAFAAASEAPRARAISGSSGVVTESDVAASSVGLIN